MIVVNVLLKSCRSLLGRGGLRSGVFHFIQMGGLLILLLPQATFAGGAPPLTLAQAVQIALQNNPEIAILRKDIEKARAEKGVASHILQANPEIGVQVRERRGGNQSLWDYELSLSQSIEIGGQRGYRMRMAEIDLLKTRLQQQKEKFVITEKVKAIFIDLTALNEKLQSLQNILRVERDLSQWLSRRAAQGEISSVKLNTVKLEALETKEKLLEVRRAIGGKRQELGWVMNSPLQGDVEIAYGWPEFPTKVALDTLKRWLGERNAEIKITSLDFKKATTKVKLIKAGRFMPNLALSLSRSREDKDNIIGVGLSIPLPIFNRKTGELRAARAEEGKAALRLQQVQGKSLSELIRYYQDLLTMGQQKRLFAREILPITQQNLDQIRARYQTGEFGLMTLERFWDNWMRAKIDYADFLQEYYHTLVKIELIMGRELREAGKK